MTSQIPEKFINACAQTMNITSEEAENHMESINSGSQELSEDVKRACSAAASITPKILDGLKMIPKCMYHNLIKGKHDVFIYDIHFIANFSDDSLSFLPEKMRKSIASDVISIILKMPGIWVNFCYLDANPAKRNFVRNLDIKPQSGIDIGSSDAKRSVNIFHIPIMEKNHEGPIMPNITRYEIAKGKWTRKDYSVGIVVEQNTSEIEELSKSLLKNLYTCPKTGLCYPPCLVCKTTKAKTKRCSKCMSVYYCSRKCQKKNWKQHKAACMLESEKNKTSE